MQDHRVASLDQNPQSPPEVPNCLGFLLASVTVPRPPQATLPPSLPPRASHQMKGLPSSSHIVPIGIVVKVAHRPSLAVVHSGLNTLPSISPEGWSPSGPDEKGHIAPHEPKRQPLIEVSGGWLVQSSCL